MPIIVKETGSNFKEIKTGSFPARCYGVILLGTTFDEMYGKKKCQVMIQFEFPSETIDDPSSEYHGQPYSMSRFYNFILSEKSSLRADLERWRNKPFTPEELLGFDLKNIIGVPCMISVVKGNTGKNKIDAVSAPMKDMPIAPQVNPSVYFDLEDFTHFDDLSTGIQNMIKRSDEYKERFNSPSGEAQGMEAPPVEFDVDDSIPF